MLSRLLPLLLLAGACSSGPGEDQLCTEAVDHSDLAWIQDNIFTPSCSKFSACHQGRASDAAHLSLEMGKSHDELVDVDSDLFGPGGSEMDGTWKRVVPGDPDHSYM